MYTTASLHGQLASDHLLYVIMLKKLAIQLQINNYSFSHIIVYDTSYVNFVSV